MKSVVTIGGGTGQFTLLSGLKKYPVKLSAIVSMADDGGSTGVLRDELGVLPPGDIRQCLVALSESETVMRELFNYRFDQGGLRGHNFGNIFLSALEKITGSIDEAVRVSGTVLATRGEVIPVTTGNVVLVAGREKVLQGQYAIELAPLLERQRETLRIEPEVYANPKAVMAIEGADCIIIGPGNFYCSIIPNLLVRGIPEAIARSRAKVVFNCNLMTKSGHSDGFSVIDFVEAVERHLGRGRLDFVTYNDREPDAELVAKYATEGAPVKLGDVTAASKSKGFIPLAADLVSRQIIPQRSGDPIKRTLIRHDSDALAALIVRNCLGGL